MYSQRVEQKFPFHKNARIPNTTTTFICRHRAQLTPFRTHEQRTTSVDDLRASRGVTSSVEKVSSDEYDGVASSSQKSGMENSQTRKRTEINSSDDFVHQRPRSTARLARTTVHGRLDILANCSRKEQNRSVRLVCADNNGCCCRFSEHFSLSRTTKGGFL